MEYSIFMGASKIVKFKAQANLRPEFTLVNEDYKFVQQRRNLHF